MIYGKAQKDEAYRQGQCILEVVEQQEVLIMARRSRLFKCAGSKRKLRTSVVKNTVFAVHGWETVDGKHTVHVWDKSGRGTDKVFNDWEDAESFAQEQAKRLGKRVYTVDTPSRPHVIERIPAVRMRIMRGGK